MGGKQDNTIDQSMTGHLLDKTVICRIIIINITLVF